jgi:hypothetical protein
VLAIRRRLSTLAFRMIENLINAFLAASADGLGLFYGLTADEIFWKVGSVRH